jgi:hypothetical protein
MAIRFTTKIGQYAGLLSGWAKMRDDSDRLAGAARPAAATRGSKMFLSSTTSIPFEINEALAIVAGISEIWETSGNPVPLGHRRPHSGLLERREGLAAICSRPGARSGRFRDDCWRETRLASAKRSAQFWKGCPGLVGGPDARAVKEIPTARLLERPKNRAEILTSVHNDMAIAGFRPGAP